MEAFISFLLFTLFMVCTPGPGNLFLMTSGANYGFKSCLRLVAGIVTGILALSLLLGFGLRGLISEHPTANIVLKVISAIMMIWLALSSWNGQQTKKSSHKKLRFRTGFLFTWVNPKGWAMLTLAWTDYAPLLGNFSEQIIIVPGAFFLCGGLAHLTWCGLGSQLGTFIQGSLALNRTLIILTVLVVLATLCF